MRSIRRSDDWYLGRRLLAYQAPQDQGTRPLYKQGHILVQLGFELESVPGVLRRLCTFNAYVTSKTLDA